MKFEKILLVTIVIVTFLSCGTGMKVASSSLKTIDSSFNGTFENTAYKTTSKPNILRYNRFLALLM